VTTMDASNNDILTRLDEGILTVTLNRPQSLNGLTITMTRIASSSLRAHAGVEHRTHLGLALDAGGHGSAAQRAFGVARAVTLQVGSERAEVALEGYKAQELLRLLDSLQRTPR